MKTDSLSNLILKNNTVEKLAIQSGLQKRRSRKIFSWNLLGLLCLESIAEAPSYNDLAMKLKSTVGEAASRQAFWKRINNTACELFMSSVLGKVMKSRTSSEILDLPYERILIQDSTVIKLPLGLNKEFGGVANQHSKVCNARIQAVYDLLSGEFVSFSIDPYSENDAKAASKLDLRNGDLVLRDRGYSSHTEIKRHQDHKADFILRYKHKGGYLDFDTFEPLDLFQLLEENVSLDLQVRLDNTAKTPIRLVAAPVNEEVANIRRMKAKKQSNGSCPSKNYLELMSWSIFLTTISKGKIGFSGLLKIYGLRWRIENIFKTWKSNFNFTAIHNVSEHQLRSILIARLIMIVIATCKIYKYLRKAIKQKFQKELSLMKLFRYLQVNNNTLIVYQLIKKKKTKDLIFTCYKYCTYENRSKRDNFSKCQKDALNSGQN